MNANQVVNFYDSAISEATITFFNMEKYHMAHQALFGQK